MEVAVVGTGFMGGILGRALARAGHVVVFGSRDPEQKDVASDSGATVASVAESLERSSVVILALPGAAVAELVRDNGRALEDKLVVDATNQMGQAVANSRGALGSKVRYARAFNTLGGENIENPIFADGPADMFFSAPEPDRAAVEELISDVGLRPVYVGVDQEDLIDALFRLWIALAMTQGRGRRLALRLLEG